MTSFTDLQKDWNEKFRKKFIHHDDSLAQPFMLLNTLDIPRLSSFLSEMATVFYEAGMEENAEQIARAYVSAHREKYKKEMFSLALKKVRDIISNKKRFYSGSGFLNSSKELLAAITKLEEEHKTI